MFPRKKPKLSKLIALKTNCTDECAASLTEMKTGYITRMVFWLLRRLRLNPACAWLVWVRDAGDLIQPHRTYEAELINAAAAIVASLPNRLERFSGA